MSAFCKYCCLFVPDGAGVGSQKLGQLVKFSYTNLKKAVEDFKAHELKQYHQDSKEKANNFLQVVNTSSSVHLQLDATYKQEIEKNQQYLIPIIDTVLLCGRQGLALRGKYDFGPVFVGETDEEQINNDGSFWAILHYRAKGDVKLSASLKSTKRNATYLSLQIQNEIINACNTHVLDALVNRVNAAKCFSILADETTDISGIEQFSLCVRYLHANDNSVAI
ncbi:zinc finger MYM-type protein 1-like [Tachypleus tridentatus]|uniref:zinc finger MYM-type protein 1-like n=1 Tax=Tachypleus tridentatus TaxID=6853 RepID=UPI003FD056CA